MLGQMDDGSLGGHAEGFITRLKHKRTQKNQAVNEEISFLITDCLIYRFGCRFESLKDPPPPLPLPKE